MDRTYETETLEEWHIRIRCSVEETPHIAAAVPKMVAGFTGCYQADVVHVHQALEAARKVRALPTGQPTQNRFHDTVYERN